MTRPVAEAFAGLNVDLQARLFNILDVVLGMSQHEKLQAHASLAMTRAAMGRLDQPQGALDLLDALHSFLTFATAAAEGGFHPGAMGLDEALRVLRDAGEFDDEKGGSE